MPSDLHPQPSGIRKLKKVHKRKLNAAVFREQAQQRWNQQQRQSRRWLTYHQQHRTFGAMPGAIDMQLQELMHAKSSAEVTTIWRRGLEPQTMQLWEKLKTERDAAKAASNRFLAPDWWVEGGGEGGGEDGGEEEEGGEGGEEEGEGEGEDGDVAMDEGVGGGGGEGSWSANLTFRSGSG